MFYMKRHVFISGTERFENIMFLDYFNNMIKLLGKENLKNYLTMRHDFN